MTARAWLRGLLLVACLVGLQACGRPLAPGEMALAADLFGTSLDTNAVRIKRTGVEGSPEPPPPLPKDPVPIKIRPGICDRVSPDPPVGPPPAFALYNQLNVDTEFYRDDLAPGWPDRILLPQVFLLAHELVHVWQWQNRALTGYRPIKAALESVLRRDPYFYVPGKGGGFLDYGFEQQASLVEDYFCYAIFDPENPRRGVLRAILSPYFRIDRVDEALAR